MRPGASARIGAGAALIDLYAALARHGLAIPTGDCPTVGIGGQVLGGGFGLSSRKLGLTLDSLRRVEIVTADGRLLDCDADHHPDLYWACRGGGGGNFGIATRFEFQTHPVGDVSIYEATWKVGDAPAVIDAWQRWAPEAPDSLYSVCELQSPGGRRPGPAVVTSHGQLFGSSQRLRELVRPLISAALPSSFQVRSMSFLDAARHWAGCTGSLADCKRVKRYPRMYKSDFVNNPMPRQAIATVVQQMRAWPGSSAPGGATFQMNAWGGAINRIPRAATAFVHRDSRVLLQYIAAWTEGDPHRVAQANLRWIANFYDRMRPYVSGFAYQNMIDPTLADWKHAYYGSNLARLVEVKRRYDPGDVFHFRQSLPVTA